MADFRKWFVVLAVFALFAGLASAQTNVCTANPAQVPVIREGGLAELVGDKILICNIVGSATTVNFQVFMTNALAVTSRFSAGSPPSQPAIIVGDNIGVGAVYLGVPAPSNPQTSILFQNVILPAGTQTQVRITNIRVAAPAVQPPLTYVNELVTVSPTQAVAINDLQPQVAAVQPSFTFSVTNCTGSGTGTTTFQQCISQPTSPGQLHFGVKFTELFPTAWKIINTGGVTTATQTNPNQNPPYGTESGLTYVGSNAVTTSDIASQGTRFIVKFTNVPAGVNLRVTDTEIGGSTGTILAEIVANAGTDGAGGTPGLATGTGATCGGSATTSNHPLGTGGRQAILVNASGQGTATQYAVWEVMSNDQFGLETVVFGVQVSYTANTSADLPGVSTTPGAVTGQLAPVSTDIGRTSTLQPRFNGPVVSGTQPFQIIRCGTTLLFPYLTSTAGYDTGMALVNTSLDNRTGSSGTPPNQPFNTPTQHGTCAVYFFGMQNGAVANIAPQVTPDVPAGQLVKFSLTSPLAGFADLTGFDGYAIARCNFQFAHGLAFIVDTHVPGFGSEAYLALVIPDRALTIRIPDPFTTAGSGTGEQLAP